MQYTLKLASLRHHFVCDYPVKARKEQENQEFFLNGTVSSTLREHCTRNILEELGLDCWDLNQNAGI